MQDIKKLVKEVLEKGYLMSLGTVDESGPWVSDVIFVFDDSFNIFWISETGTRHSMAILKNPKVAATITLSNNRGEENIGLQMEGTAQRIEGDILDPVIQLRQISSISSNGTEVVDNSGMNSQNLSERISSTAEVDILGEMAKQHRRKRGKPEPKEGENILDEGEAWYCLKPSKIELIYEPLFGFEKKSLDF